MKWITTTWDRERGVSFSSNPNTSGNNIQYIPCGSKLKHKCIQTDKRPSPAQSWIGTCEGFRVAVLSSVGNWSSVTYRALVANAVITKQSCSRIQKEKKYIYIYIYKEKKGRWKIESRVADFLVISERLGISFSLKIFGCIYIIQSHDPSRNSPVWCYGCVSHAKAPTPQSLPAPTCNCKTNHAPPPNLSSRGIILVWIEKQHL